MNENTARPEITPEYLAEQGLSKTFPERFWKRVFITPTHWLWDGMRRAPMNHGSLWRGVRNPRTGKWQWMIYAHVASWLLNRGPIPEGKWILHKCPGKHIPWCVNPEHLYLGSAKDNSRDQLAQGTMYLIKGHKHNSRGERSTVSKLTEAQVLEIRKIYSGRTGQQSELAKQYGVAQPTIENILVGKNWKHMGGAAPGLIARRERIARDHSRIRRPFPMTGENGPLHKLTRFQVKEIRDKYTGERGQQSKLAREYRVRQGTIWYIVNNVTWKG